MTEEQIIELAQEHLEVLITEGESEVPTDFAATREQLIAFAQAIYEIGVDSGWEQRAEGEYLNSSYPN